MQLVSLFVEAEDGPTVKIETDESQGREERSLVKQGR